MSARRCPRRGACTMLAAMTRSGVGIGAVLWLAAAALACNPARTSMQLGLPGAGQDMTVTSVQPRGGYLDVTLQGDGFGMRTFLPANETCQRVVAREATVRHRTGSTYGRFERDGERCDAAGIADLREWRNRRPRETSRVVPSGRATYRVVFADEEVTFLRGVFPLVGLLGFAGMGDTIAVVPNTAVCQGPIGRGASTIEYFHGGRNVLTLSSAEGRCNIVALLRPLAPADVAP